MSPVGIQPRLMTGERSAFAILFEDSSLLQNLKHQSLLPFHLFSGSVFQNWTSSKPWSIC